MIDYSSNISVIVADKLSQLTALKNNPDTILRSVAFAVLPELVHRVHQEGKDSSGSPIGTYSPEYMKVRTGQFSTNDRFSKGKNKGDLKSTGVFTKGRNKGEQRPRYNRTGDTKVVLSLTRQMENDTSVIPTPNGWGIGYHNHLNYEKALWCEETYQKPILTQLTADEIELARKTAQDFTDEYLNKN